MSRKFPFSGPLKAQILHRAETTNPLIVSELTVGRLLSCTYSCKRSMCLSFHFSSNPRGFPTLLSPTLLICHQWMSCNLLYLRLLLWLYCTKQGAELPFSGAFSQHVEVLFPSNCQFSSNKLIKILTGLDVS